MTLTDGVETGSIRRNTLTDKQQRNREANMSIHKMKRGEKRWTRALQREDNFSERSDKTQRNVKCRTKEEESLGKRQLLL